ncbi:uncharacterized protein N7469_002996 [Penicillium citrinum]|uniref:T6SS Phospholipase effector Tle1-like catalytic domain-containing protein n=2 Tax=Penicillium TaxID=5073 RepID=A0A9W9TU21_PENCI|nr:uncharacterized protein N7469_002996 [Penicillium citrinum]KAJ5241405.1 hypothetical protein N7469_002996 [Penicillium citrinum]KAJ5586411.1 hypothetical protein N7450_006198 [Penicillium hetheringtonii]
MAEITDPNIPPPSRKRIIICCDGSGQSAVSGEESIPSNVTRLCRAIDSVGVDADGRAWQQVVWYDSGVGTNSNGQVSAGRDLEGNVIEAYNFCVLNWNPGDRILCFGFSRGAYTARAIAGLISDLGICSKTDIQDFPEVWRLYKKSHTAVTGDRFYGSDAYFDWQDGKPADPQPEERQDNRIVWESLGRGEWAQTPESREIEVVGVFETVGALGFPEVFGYEVPQWLTRTDKPEWHNVGLSPNIKNAFQALALDEHRAAFTPTLFYIPNVTKASKEAIEKQQESCQAASKSWNDLLSTESPSLQDLKQISKGKNEAMRKLLEMEDSQKDRSKLLQVWFPGVHINIGGGSTLTLENKGNMEEMSNIVFAWMLDRIKGFLSINEKTLQKEQVARQARLTRINNALHWYNERLSRRQTETWGKWFQRGGQWIASSILHPLTPGDKPAYMDERVYTWGLGDLPDNFGIVYIANGSRPRTPGRYALDKKGQKLGETYEQIHPVVGYRVEKTKDHAVKEKRYRPICLMGNSYERREKKEGGFEYLFKYPGMTQYQILPEWKLSGDVSSYERLAIVGDVPPL